MTFCSSGQHVFLLLPCCISVFPPDQLWWLALWSFNENCQSSIHIWFSCYKCAFSLISHLLFLYPLFLSFFDLCHDLLYNAIHYPHNPVPAYFHCAFLSSYRDSCSSSPLVSLVVSSLYFSTLIFQLAVFSATLYSWHEWLLFFSGSLCFRSSFSSGIYSSWIFHTVFSFLLCHVLKSHLKTGFYVLMATATSDSVTKASTELILQCFSCLPYHMKMGEVNFLIWWLITLH